MENIVILEIIKVLFTFVFTKMFDNTGLEYHPSKYNLNQVTCIYIYIGPT